MFKSITEVILCMLKRLKGQNRFYAPELLYGATENIGALRFMPVLSKKFPLELLNLFAKRQLAKRPRRAHLVRHACNPVVASTDVAWALSRELIQATCRYIMDHT